MKSFFWKTVLVVTPCILATWVTVIAVIKYVNGDPGGFKLGVDLVGGTILVYEIDLRKSKASDPSGQQFDPVKDINVLAEALKRRIDPNDLKNIIIRPAGGEGRVEIILPTGGTHRTAKAETAWNKLLEDMKVTWKVEKLEVGRGKILELADRIQFALSQKNWREKLFTAEGAWPRLLEKSYKVVDYPDAWAELDTDETKAAMSKLTVGDIAGLETLIITNLSNTERPTNERAVQQWIKRKAWEELLLQVRKEWPNLEAFKTDLDNIAVDSIDQLATFIQSRGSVIGQAGLAIVQQLAGPTILEDVDPPEELWKAKDANDPKAKEQETKLREEWRKKLNYEYIEKFITDYYGPSLRKIQKSINDEMEGTGRNRDVTVEEVQRIKDMVAKVGSLEFQMLANSEDDKLAIKEAKGTLNAAGKESLEELAKNGEPPPPPSGRFTLSLPRNQKSIVEYEWVELGPQERKTLNLDNAARNDPARNGTWLEAQKLIGGEANVLHDLNFGANRKPLLQGALFFARKCINRNLPDEERRQKDVEYFVLARKPEIDPKTQLPTSKIDGKYLVSAYSSPGSDLQPAVHFTFNNEGGNLFGELTRKNVPSESGPESSRVRRHLAIILDRLVMSAPTINSEIRNQGQISGNFTQKEVDDLVNILRAGRLPATLKPQPVSENTVGATLGQDTIESGVKAIGVAFVLVLGFMVVYYRFAGFVACVALLANLVLTIGFMVAVQATFTLPGLAGLVLMLGMAVDANVLIYERFREERDRGANIMLAIRNAYERSFPTIIDTHLSSMFTAIVLYVVGNDQLKGFGVSLAAGLAISLFTSLYMTRLMFDFWVHKGWLKNLNMLRFFSKPDIDFMGIRNVMFLTSVGLAILGIALFIGRLPGVLNIDFVGGTAYGGQLVKPVDVSDLRGLVDEEHQKKWLQLADVKEEEDSQGLRFQLTYQNPDGSKETPFTIGIASSPYPDPAPPSDPKDKPAYESRLKEVRKLREDEIKERASQLPDATVEQIFVSQETGAKEKETTDADKSRYFNIRTREKEPEIVRATLTRLLRDKDGAPLMKTMYMQVEKSSNREWRLKFYQDQAGQQPDFASPSFVKSLFTREFKKELKAAPAEASRRVQYFDLYGEGKSTGDGRHAEMRLKFESDVPADVLPVIAKALQTTERNFEVSPAPDRLETFDSQLATETRYRALWAILASWFALLIYVWFRFGNWTFGAAAVLCLVHDVFFSLGAIAICHYIYHWTPWLAGALMIQDFKVDLTTVAAILTLVGYSINDKIVVYDRMREVRGKNPDLTPQIINDSINQSLSRTLLTGISVLLVLLVLYIFGGEGVHLFAFVMTIGMIVGTYSSIYVASPLLLIFGEGARSTARTLERHTGVGVEGTPA